MRREYVTLGLAILGSLIFISAPFVAPVAATVLPPLTIERTIELKNNDTLEKAFTRAGLPQDQVKALLAPMAKSPTLRKGQEITLTYTEESPYRVGTANLSLRTKPDEITHLNYNKGVATAQIEIRPLIESRSVAVGEINRSLYQDATEAGLPAGLIKPFVDLFAWDLDFTRDVHPGDTFKVMYEETQDDTGERVKHGKILAAEFYVKGGKRTAYLYNGDYYDEKGNGKKKLLLRTPLETYRISSGFNLARKHPVLGYTRAHRGTDFAAPMGTPVKASGDGTVVFVGKHGGHGNFVKIRHNGTYQTAYAHLSRYAKNLHVGSKVSQGQIIAYVGSTGVSTGPHLHYEVIVNGQQVNAMSTKLPTTTLLAGKDKSRFTALVAEAQGKWNKAWANIQVASR